MESTVQTAVAALTDLQPSDQAAVELALMYAANIDTDPDLIDKLGPKLLAALDALGATPKARKAQTGKAAADDSAPTNPLHRIRDDIAARRARMRGTPAVDAAATGTDA